MNAVSGDRHAQLKQLTDHAQVLRVDLHAAEAAGAAVPAIHDAKELLEAAILKAVEAINQGARAHMAELRS